MPINLTFLDILLTFLCGFVAGGAGAAMYYWSLRRTVYELEYSVISLEGRLSREVKVRASDKGRAAKAEQDELEQWALANREAGHQPRDPKPSKGPLWDAMVKNVQKGS